jgi:hypothetical protein
MEAMLIHRLFLIVCALLISFPAFAQFTGGVSGPDITEGGRSIGYRAALDPDSNGLAQRVHVQSSLNGDLAVRGVVQFHKTDGSSTSFDFFQGEVRWQITSDAARWKSGLRADVRLRDGNQAGQASLHWLNQTQVSEALRARLAVIATIQAGPNRQKGLLLQTRGDLSGRLTDNIDAGVEIYNSYGPADSILPVAAQSHLVGPFVSLPLTASLNLRTSALIGLTERSPDATFRVFLDQNF